MRIETIHKLADLNQILTGEGSLHLSDGLSPNKDQSFYLFRGENNACFELTSSLSRYAKKRADKHGLDWRVSIQDIERDFLDRFLDEIYQKRNYYKKQYSWIDLAMNVNDFETDTFRIMSIMQHYGGPTRLIDFTTNALTALFFATDGFDVQNTTHFAIYRLRCKNEDCHDRGGNKCPKYKGEPFRETPQSQFNGNTLLGRIIGYKPYLVNTHPRIDLRNDPSWKNPDQPYGWDRPEFQNPRLTAQNGFFLYHLDVRETAEEAMSRFDALEKFRIDRDLLDDARKILAANQISMSSLYLDLDYTFEGWKLV